MRVLGEKKIQFSILPTSVHAHSRLIVGQRHAQAITYVTPDDGFCVSAAELECRLYSCLCHTYERKEKKPFRNFFAS